MDSSTNQVGSLMPRLTRNPEVPSSNHGEVPANLTEMFSYISFVPSAKCQGMLW